MTDPTSAWWPWTGDRGLPSHPTCPVVDNKEVWGCPQELVGHHGIDALVAVQSQDGSIEYSERSPWMGQEGLGRVAAPRRVPRPPPSPVTHEGQQ